MHFRMGALKDFGMLTEKNLCWSLFLINIQVWRPVTLLRRDSVKFAKIFKNTYFYRTHPVAASGNISSTFSLLHLRTMNGVFRGTCWLPSVYFILLRVFRFFLFLFFFWFFLWIPLLFSFEVSLLSILKKRSGVVTRFLSEVSRRALLQPYLVINLPGLVQFGKNLSYILPALAS